MNKVGKESMMHERPLILDDPYAIEWVPGFVWFVAPHEKILGWVRRDAPDVLPWRRRFHVYTHGVNETGRVWITGLPTLGSAVTYIRQHAAEMTQWTLQLEADPIELVDGEPRRRVNA
jgi:hypothetical protein